MQSRLKSLAALLPLLFTSGILHAETADPIIVTATRQPARTSEVLADVTIIGRDEIEKNAQGTISDLLSRQPGIQVSASGGPGSATSVYIRGANSNQTKVLIDGLPINSIDLSGSPLRFIPLDDVERIEILRGAASTLYGADALGGVIHVITKRGAPGFSVSGFVGYGSDNTRQASAALSAGDTHWRLRIEGNNQQSAGFSAQKDASNKDADDDSYRNTGGAVSFSLLPADGHEFGLNLRRNSGLVEHDSGNHPANGNYDDRTRFENEQWQVFAKNRLSAGWNSTLQYGEATDEQRDHYWDAWAFPAGAVETRLNTRTRQMGWQNDVRLPLGKALVALERLTQEISPRANYTQDPEISNNSLLLGWSAGIGAHSWQLNARHDQHSDFGGQGTYGFAYGYQISSFWRARASLGTAFKAPTPYQLFMTSSWGNGNPDLQPEKARNREIALVWEAAGQSASATYYRNDVDNLIDWISDPMTWIGTYENVNKARLQGVTLSYEGRFDLWTIRAAYDWLDATDERTGFELGRRARNKALLGISRQWGALDSGIEVVGVGRRFNDNTENERLGGYSLVNLTARYILSKDVSLEGRINNLFDRKYETVRHYETAGLNAFVGLRFKFQ